MEGAIKLLQFCIEQRQAGNMFRFGYLGYMDKYEIWGAKGLLSEQTIVVQSSEYWTSPEDLTPERADQIINEIKEKLK